MSVLIRKFLERLISSLKNEKYVLDSKIPLSYLLSETISRCFSFILGYLFVCRRNTVFLHRTSVVRCAKMIDTGGNLSIARGCYVDALSVYGLRFGDNVSIGINTHIQVSGTMKQLGKGIKIGNNVGLGTHGYYGGGIGGLEIGDDTIIGNYVSFHPENHNYSDRNTLIRLQGVSGKGIRVGSNCWIGAKSTFLDGSKVGNNCVVAAGAVVNGVFEDNCVIGGVPAKVLKKI